jgi:hypothetical protein
MSQPTIQSIINNSRNRETAIANFNANVTSGNALDSNVFYRELDRKFPIQGGTGSTGGNNDKKDGPTAQGFFGGIIEKSGEFLQAFEQQEYFPSLDKEIISVNNVVQTLIDGKGELNKLSVIGNSMIKGAANQLLLYYQQQSALLKQINGEAGLTGDLSKNFREELTNANPRLLQLGIGFSDLADAVNKAFENSGRFNLINQQTLERGGEIALSYVGSLRQLTEMYGEFEKVGLGASNAQESIARAGKESLSLGLRAKTTTAELSRNIGKLNEFGFKNGIDGLSSMVRKATEFRMSINEAFKIAEKVMDPDGALELSANLQVLGGAIGDFNDPLKLMYMATNNVEGLQDALIGAAKGLATYNSEQGRFEITGVNLRRAREMAKQLGVDYGELAKGAIAAAEKTSASADLMARGLQLDKKQEEFITNLAQMKDGKMVIEIGSSESLKKYFDGQSTVKLEELTQSQVNELIRQQDQLKKMSENEIVRQQATSIENIKRDVNFIAALMRVEAGRLGDDLVTELVKLSSGGKTGEDIAAELNKISTELGGNIRGGRDAVKSYAKEIYNDAKSLINGEDKKGNKTNQTKEGTPPKKDNTTKTTDNGPAAAASDLNKKKEPVYDSGKSVNPNSANNQKPVESKVPTTPPNSQIPSKKEEEKKEPEKPITVDVNLPNPLTAKIINENPINTTLSGESIKALESQKNLTTTEPNKPNNKFLGDFESRYGRINEPKDINPTQTGKVDNASLDRKLVIEKVESSNAQSTLASNNNELNKTEENKSVATVEHKHIVEMRVSSTGPIVDVLARAMLKDPTIVSQFIERDVREFV